MIQLLFLLLEMKYSPHLRSHGTRRSWFWKLNGALSNAVFVKIVFLCGLSYFESFTNCKTFIIYLFVIFYFRPQVKQLVCAGIFQFSQEYECNFGPKGYIPELRDWTGSLFLKIFTFLNWMPRLQPLHHSMGYFTLL